MIALGRFRQRKSRMLPKIFPGQNFPGGAKSHPGVGG